MGTNEPATREENNWVGRRGRGSRDMRREMAEERQATRDRRSATEQLEVLAARGVDVENNMGKECVKLRKARKEEQDASE